MNLLLDESLSPRLRDLLRAAGHDVVQARDVGLISAAPLSSPLALDDRRVLLTLDTDFGALFAFSGARQPSVVLFRGEVPVVQWTRPGSCSPFSTRSQPIWIKVPLSSLATIAFGCGLPVERDQ